MDITNKSPEQLLILYADIIKELKNRKIIRTNNAPLADYAEWLVKEKLNYILENNSNKGYDCVDSKGLRYQVKCRRCVGNDIKSQLGVIRKYDDEEFDYLIGILFNEDFSIRYAYKMPHAIIKKYSRYSSHQNGHILQLKGDVLNDPQSINISDLLK